MKRMKILLAIDSSPASKAAASEVAARPWPPATTFEVLNVVDPSYVPSAAIDDLARHSAAVVQETASRLVARGLAATPNVLRGHPQSAIVDRAREMAASLVVVGSHNTSGIERFLLGSVASAVVRHATCSVEVVRAREEYSGGTKILLATDGSPSSLAAARSIAQRPWPAGTEIRVLTALELSLTMLQSTLEPPFLNSETMELQRAEAMKRAEDAVQSAEGILAGAGLRTSESISVLIESPKQIILEEAKEWGADLIVVGSHGRSGLDRFLLGSVSEAVAMHAPCSVEIIRSADSKETPK
jgi:nucleotide-binding universal stress UspA family protein